MRELLLLQTRVKLLQIGQLLTVVAYLLQIRVAIVIIETDCQCCGTGILF